MRFNFILLICLPVLVNAEIYQWRDANGNPHYSDRHDQGAKRVNIKPGYSFYRVKTVYDGDTLVIEDGRKIRLLGINTPEVQHRDKLGEAGGEKAKRWLIDRLKNTKIRIETDIEKVDKYGRMLAHVFTESKEHINLQLVEAGLASVNIYPPNLLYADQLTRLQQKAEDARAGIWQENDYAAVPVEQLPDSGRSGWTRLQGRVIDIRTSRKYIYLKLSSRFQAKIERKWMFLFPDIDEYLGKTIEVRGWLNKNRDGFTMLIRHPSAIKPS